MSSPARGSRSMRARSCTHRRRVRQHAPLMQFDPALAARRELRVVGHQHERGAVVAVQREQQVGDVVAGALVEVAGGFVGEQQARALVRACASPSSSSGSITFSSALSAGSRWKDWNTKPTRRRRRSARASSSSVSSAWPLRRMLPELGVSSPARRPSKVVLPEPDAPTMAKLSPAATCRPTRSRICSRPSGPSTDLLTSCASRTRWGVSLMRRFLCLLLWLAGAVVAVQAAPARTVLVLGDSLSAAHNIATEQGWVHLLEVRLGKMVPPWAVVNASISGETSLSGRNRLPALLATYRPGVVVIELGANDGLRGLPLNQLRDNLTATISAAQATHAKVLLLGIELPVNYGPQYRDGLRAVYADLAKQKHVALLPFLLDGVALDPALMQADGLH